MHSATLNLRDCFFLKTKNVFKSTEYSDFKKSQEVFSVFSATKKTPAGLAQPLFSEILRFTLEEQPYHGMVFTRSIKNITSLSKLVADKKYLEDSTTKPIAYQLASAFASLHENNISCGVVVPEAILISTSSPYKVQLCFFDNWIPGSGSTDKRKLLLEANECEDDSGYNYKKADVFHLGGLLYFMLTGKFIYLMGKTVEDVLKKTTPALSSSAQDLLSNMFNPTPEKRYSIQKALEHAWFKDAKTSDKA